MSGYSFKSIGQIFLKRYGFSSFTRLPDITKKLAIDANKIT